MHLRVVKVGERLGLRMLYTGMDDVCYAKDLIAHRHVACVLKRLVRRRVRPLAHLQGVPGIANYAKAL
jgi:hypothetical protein